MSDRVDYGSQYELARREEWGLGLAADRAREIRRLQAAEEAVSAPSGVKEVAGATLRDLGGGVIETPAQAWGGAMDAIDGAGNFLGDIFGAMKNTPNGWQYMRGDELISEREAAESIFQKYAPDDADTVTGSLVRGISQFMAGFGPWAKGVQAVAGAGKGFAGQLGRATAAGALADATVFDPGEGRLSTLLNEVPGLDPIVPDYLADVNPDNDARWEERMKNVLEGAGVGLIGDSVIQALRAYKAVRRARTAERREAEAKKDQEALLSEVEEKEGEIDVRTRQAIAAYLARPRGGAIGEEVVIPEWDIATQEYYDRVLARERMARRSRGSGPQSKFGGGPRVDMPPPPQRKPGQSMADYDRELAAWREQNSMERMARVLKDARKLESEGGSVKARGRPLRGTRILRLDVEMLSEKVTGIATQAQRQEFLRWLTDRVKPIFEAYRGGADLKMEDVKKAAKEKYRASQDLQELLGTGPMDFLPYENQWALLELLRSQIDFVTLTAAKARSADATDVDAFVADFHMGWFAQLWAISEGLAAKGARTLNVRQAFKRDGGLKMRAFRELVSDTLLQRGGADRIRALSEALLNTRGIEEKMKLIRRRETLHNTRRALFVHWVNSILSSPKTHAVNLIGNTATPFYAIPERWLAEKVSSMVYGGEIRAGEARAMMWGFAQGVPDTFRVLRRMWRKPREGDKPNSRMEMMLQEFQRQSKLDHTMEGAIRAASLGMKPTSAFGKAFDYLGRGLEIPTSLLQSEDVFGKTLAYRMELQALAFREVGRMGDLGELPSTVDDALARYDTAMRESGLYVKDDGSVTDEFGVRMAAEKARLERMAAADGSLPRHKDRVAAMMHQILEEPPEHLHLGAMDKAHYLTFTTPLGELGQAGMNFMRRIPGARLVIPFVRTPVNIMKFTLQRTPLALLAASIRRDIQMGGAAGAEALAKIGLGTSFLMMATHWATSGYVSGGGSLDPRIAATERRIRPPYSVKVGESWYAYNRLDPFGMIIGMGADIGDVISNTDDEELLAQVIAATVVGLMNNLSSKTYLTGLFDFAAAIDPRNPTKDPQDWIVGMTGTLAPYSAFMRAVAQTADPIQREGRVAEIDDGATPAWQFLQSSINRIKMGIPGLSSTLPPRYGIWGDVQERYPRDRDGSIIESAAGMTVDILNPMFFRQYSGDPVDLEIIENQTALSYPQRRMMGVPLSPTEFAFYSRRSGQISKAILDRLVNTPRWHSYSKGRDGLRSAIIRDAVARGRKLARAELLRDPEMGASVRQRIRENRFEKRQALKGEMQ